MAMRATLMRLAAASKPAAAAAASSSSSGPLGAFRTMGPLGAWMRDQPNHVKEDMIFMQLPRHKETTTHTYLKRESDKFFFYGVFGLLGLGGIMALRGYADMILGWHKKAE